MFSESGLNCWNQNQNNLLVKRQNYSMAPGVKDQGRLVPGSNQRSEPSQSSDVLAAVIKESGRSFQALIVVGKKKLCL